MRCAWFLTDLAGGGAERLPLLLAPHFQDAALDLILLKNRIQHRLPSPPPSIRALAPAETRLGRNAFRILRRAIEAARESDVIVGGMEWDATIAAVACGIWLRRPVIGIVHIDLFGVYGTLPIPAARWRLFAWALRRCRAVVGVSRDAVASAKRMGVSEARLHLVPNPAPVVAEAPARGDTAGRPRLVTVGRLVPMKGIDVILDAAARLPDLDLHWDVLGDGPERESLEDRAHRLAAHERVRFHGFVPDPGPFLSSADLFVMASRFEGMPLAMTEAMAHGLPVVATRCNAGVEELVGEGEDAAGLLVPVDDAAALADAIRRALERPDQRRRWGANARARAAELAPERVAERYEELFRAVVGSPGALGSA